MSTYQKGLKCSSCNKVTRMLYLHIKIAGMGGHLSISKGHFSYSGLSKLTRFLLLTTCQEIKDVLIWSVCLDYIRIMIIAHGILLRIPSWSNEGSGSQSCTELEF